MEKMRLSCEIDEEGFLIKAHLCTLRVMLRSLVLRGVYTLVKDVCVIVCVCLLSYVCLCGRRM